MIKIGALEIPEIAGFDLSVSYQNLGPKALKRTKNGSAILFSRWDKKGISISGSGWLPDGLDGIDENALVDIHSTAFMSKASAGNVITIPRAFRTDDYAPQGIALVNGNQVETPVALIGSVATLTVVPGATQYQVIYCPVLTAFITRIERSFNEQSNVWSWSIEAEEQ